jgi:hypothetical protein
VRPERLKERFAITDEWIARTILWNENKIMEIIVRNSMELIRNLIEAKIACLHTGN